MGVLVLGLVVVLPVLLSVAAVLVAPTNPGAEPVVLALLVPRNVMMGVAPVPPEFVLFVSRHIHVLKVSVRLAAAGSVEGGIGLLRPGISRAEAHQKAHNELQNGV